MICNKIPGKDKTCHFIGGFIIAIAVAYFLNPLYGLVAGVSVGVLKEAMDEYRYGGADFFDLFATILGTVIGIMALHLFRVYIL